MALVPMTPDIDGKYRLDASLLSGSGGRSLRLVVREPERNVIVRRFETVHEQPFHLFVVSGDLRNFLHVHPVARPDGSLELTPAPRWRGPYEVYADFLRSAARRS